VGSALQLAKIDDPEPRADLLPGVSDGVLTVATIRAEVQALRPKHPIDGAVPAAGVVTLPCPKGGRWTVEGGEQHQDALPGESTVQRILMHWNVLRQDEEMRPKVDATLARTRALITDMA